MNSSKISSRQLFFLLFCSRATVLFYNSVFLDIKISAAEYAVSSLFGIGIILLVMAAAGKRRIRQSEIFKSLPFKIILFILYFAVTVETITQLSRLLRELYGSAQPTAAVLVLALFIVFYALTRGIEGTVRFSFIAAIIFAVTTAAAVVLTAGEFSADNLSHISEIKGAGLSSAFIKNFLFFPELVLFVSFLPFLNKPLKTNKILTFAIFITVITAAFVVFTQGVLGQLVYGEKLPIIMLFEIGEISVFRRMDSARLCACILMEIVKLFAFSQGINIILRETIFKKKEKEKNDIYACFTVLGILLVASLCSSLALSRAADAVAAVICGLCAVCYILTAISILRRKKT